MDVSICIFAEDPAHMGSKRQADIDKGLHERKVGLGVEESGLLEGLERQDLMDKIILWS